MKAHTFAAIAFLGLMLFGEPATREATAEPQQGQRAVQRDNMRFREMDTNNDGRISRDEWRGNLRAFRNHDKNNDGVLSGNEVWVRQQFQAAGNLGDRFADIDTNNNGRIERREWVAAFDWLDRNEDGAITRTEAEDDAPANDPVGTSGWTPIDDNRTIVVNPRTMWTDTGIDVTPGMTLGFAADGTITLSASGTDTASPNGSRNGRRAANSPLTSVSAGTLLARIGNGEPLFVGSQQTFSRIQAAGRLYLGVNDDYLGDNGGEFRVRLTVSGR